jgi:hypothetical protein
MRFLTIDFSSFMNRAHMDPCLHPNFFPVRINGVIGIFVFFPSEVTVCVIIAFKGTVVFGSPLSYPKFLSPSIPPSIPPSISYSVPSSIPPLILPLSLSLSLALSLPLPLPPSLPLHISPSLPLSLSVLWSGL